MLANFHDADRFEAAVRGRLIAAIASSFMTPAEMYEFCGMIRNQPTVDDAYQRWVQISGGPVKPALILRSQGSPLFTKDTDWQGFMTTIVALVLVELKKRGGKPLTGPEVIEAFKNIGINISPEAGAWSKIGETSSVSKAGSWIWDNVATPVGSWLGEHWPEVVGGIIGLAGGPGGSAAGAGAGALTKAAARRLLTP